MELGSQTRPSQFGAATGPPQVIGGEATGAAGHGIQRENEQETKLKASSKAGALVKTFEVLVVVEASDQVEEMGLILETSTLLEACHELADHLVELLLSWNNPR